MQRNMVNSIMWTIWQQMRGKLLERQNYWKSFGIMFYVIRSGKNVHCTWIWVRHRVWKYIFYFKTSFAFLIPVLFDGILTLMQLQLSIVLLNAKYPQHVDLPSFFFLTFTQAMLSGIAKRDIFWNIEHYLDFIIINMS